MVCFNMYIPYLKPPKDLYLSLSQLDLIYSSHLVYSSSLLIPLHTNLLAIPLTHSLAPRQWPASSVGHSGHSNERFGGSERCMQIPTLSCGFGLSLQFVLPPSPCYFHLSFLTACPVDFRLQHQTQKQQLHTDHATSRPNCIRSKPQICVIISHVNNYM